MIPVRPAFVLVVLLVALLVPAVAAQEFAVITETPRPGAPQLRIRSTPDDADVTINNRYVGRTPITVNDLSPGTHRVVITRAGYRTVDRWIRLRDNSISELDVTLEQRVGFLAVTVEPETAELFLNGARLRDTGSRQPIGEYTLAATAFGYRTASQQVVIREGRTTSVTVVLHPAPFELSSVSVVNERFNPQAPGPRGFSTVRFAASAPGRAEITVTDSQGLQRLRAAIDELEADNRFRWDGRDPDGTPLPDGSYTIVVAGAGTSDDSSAEIRRTVVIDSSIRPTYRSLAGGSSGALFAPDTAVLPARTYQVAAGSVGRWTGSRAFDRAHSHLGIRIGLGVDLETALVTEVAVSAAEPDTNLQAALSLRWAYADPMPSPRARFTGAIQTVGSVASGSGPTPLPRDTTANHSRWAVSVPTGIVLGPVRAVATPELVLSNTHPLADDTSGRFPLLWGYGRATLLYDSGATVAALSAALRVQPWFREVDSPVSVAAEFHRLIPGTPLFLSVLVGGELGRAGSFIGGVGLGILP